MKSTFCRIPFYFLRHGETDHNVRKIYDDCTETHLNENGKQQAIQVERILRSLPIVTVCSSPLLRAQQTKNIVVGNKPVDDVVIDEFRECPSSLWRLFLAAETRELAMEERALIHAFTNQVKSGLEKALQYNTPILLVAHGGTYWALTHLLELEGNRKIRNCELTYIFPEGSENWKAGPIVMK